MFDTFGGDEGVGDFFHKGGAAAHDEDFQAVVMIQMNVEGGDDGVVVVVLDIGEGGLDMGAVVVVHEGDGAGDLLVAELLAVFHEGGAHDIGDGEGAVLETFFRDHGIELAEQLGREGDAEAVGERGFHRFNPGWGAARSRGIFAIGGAGGKRMCGPGLHGCIGEDSLRAGGLMRRAEVWPGDCARGRARSG